jgi:hypothetical protein
MAFVDRRITPFQVGRTSWGSDMKLHMRGLSSAPPDREMPGLPRTIDLFGRAADGRPMLWKRAVRVDPVSAFERRGRWIVSGHYVIDHKGDAIVVHCGNADDGNVSVQFMHNEPAPYMLPRRMIESMLLGKVALSEELQATVFEGRRLTDFFANAHSTVVAKI